MIQIPTRLLPPKVSLEELAVFCGNLATCLAAGLEPVKSLQAAQPWSAHSSLRRIIEHAIPRVAQRQQFSDALEPSQESFPAFFLPVLRCGEQSGRIDETLRYLEQHCRMLAGPARIMRNTWLVPLGVMLAGSAASAIGYAILAPFQATLSYVFHAVIFYAALAGTCWCAFGLPALRPIVDRLFLLIPVVGQAERELATNRFFHAMSLLYSTGGTRVEQMIRLAAVSAGNKAMCDEFLPAARVIEDGGTITEAFLEVQSLPAEYKSLVTAGDEAGKLEAAFDTAARRAGEAAQHRLAMFQQFFFRVVTAIVVGSITMTLLSLILLRRY